MGRLAALTGTGEDRWERPGPTPAQQRNDVLVGVAVALLMVLSLTLASSVGIGFGDLTASMAESVAWSLAISLPLVVRRRYPVGVLVVVSLLFIGMQSRFVPEAQVSSIVLFVALYSAGAWGRDRAVATWARAGVVVVMFAWLAYSVSATAWADVVLDVEDADGPLPGPLASAVYTVGLNVAYFAAAWVFGDLAWRQARQRETLDRRNAELAAERDRTARQADVAERVRIARELHDVVAHHVSVMGVQAAGARRVLDRDPDLARATLEAVEESGRTAVAEMHRLLGVLRAEDDDGAPPDPARATPAAGLEALPALVDRFAAAGTQAGLTVVGDPRTLPPSVSVSAYRVVQEALTNVLRHAGATRVDVRLRHLPEHVEVEVVDDGLGRSARPGAGLGLVGMRERVAMHGGELEAGPRQTGGYRVRARFPVGSA